MMSESCNKIKYEKDAAEKLAKELKRKAKKCFGNTNRQEKRAYLCPACKSYHLTSISQNEWELAQKKKRENERLLNIKKEKDFQLLIKRKTMMSADTILA
jgi:Zn finger protein HypA/HybF involved in hydrogenase expression